MRRRIYLPLVICFAGSILVVASLFAISDHIVHKRNNFVRVFPPHSLVPSDTLDVRYNSYYFAGTNGSRLYLGNTTAPLHVKDVDILSLEDRDRLITGLGIEQRKFWSARVKVDSSIFFLVDGAVPVILSGDVDDFIVTGTAFDSAYFVDMEPTTLNSFVMRSVRSSTQEFELAKAEFGTSRVSFNDSLLRKQVDGRFCVDGMLHFNQQLQYVIYLYYYRNEFIVADPDLNLVYRGKTIDDIAVTEMQIVEASDGTRTHAKPPMFVNKQSCTWGNYLMVASALMAKNEDPSVFRNTSVLDVYDLTYGKYLFSFYIPEYDGKRMHDFAVYGDKLFILMGSKLISYDLVLKYFNLS